MFVLSVLGFGLCIYLGKWDVAITTAPFTVHFSIDLYEAYSQQRLITKQLAKLRRKNRLQSTYIRQLKQKMEHKND